MKDDFFSFNHGRGPDESPDKLDAFESFTNLADDDSEDADLLSNWSLGLDDSGERSSVLHSSLRTEASTPSSNVIKSTVLEGFEAQFSIMAPLVENSLWNATPRGAPSTRLMLPGLNDEIFGFRLLYELGAGAFAKVFLAMQGELADREVVLKISAIEGTEPQTLAQLQHTHVVPIYSVHEDTRLGLRAVCMPYFGGAALSKVLEDLWADKRVPASGQALIEALDKVSGPEPATKVAQRIETSGSTRDPLSGIQSAHTARNVIAGLNFVQTSAWIICRLAEGLQHSHERNVIHRDIKPSNILMSAESQPLLLDFNVSQAFDCNPEDASMGGTLSYMAPEHLRAMLEQNAEDTKSVNQRSDIYSLGLVLYEMLTGSNPFSEPAKGWITQEQRDALIREREREVPSLRQHCKLEIPWSLESIVRKCLAPCPLDRYLTAAQLAEDLTRFLQDLPLKFAPELSRTEQVQKWVRRHPRLTTTAIATVIAAALIIPGGILLSMTREDLAAKQNLLAVADTAKYARKFRDGTLDSLFSLIAIAPNKETLRSGIATCDETLAIYGVLTNEKWQEGNYWRRLSDTDRQALAEKVRELLIVLADAKVREAPRLDSSATTALKLLKRAEQIAGLPTSRALLLERAKYLSLLRQDADAQKCKDEAEKVPAVTAHDLYMLGSAHARLETEADWREAIKLLSQSIKKEPQNYWAHFERAICYAGLRNFPEALVDLGTCRGLLPKSSWAEFNLGCLMARQHHLETAVDHYSTAIDHDPLFEPAYFNRGLAQLEQQHFEKAFADFQKAKDLGRDDAAVAAGQAMALEGLGRHSDADQLFSTALDRSEGSDFEDRISWTYAFAVGPRAPHIARRVFENIIKDNPNHPQALYGQGMLSMGQGQLEEAVGWFDRSIAADSKLLEPLRYRAICLARLGKLKQAGADAKFCLEQDGNNPDTQYAVACVSALIARKLNSQDLKDYALDRLQEAIDLEPEQDRPAIRKRASTDPDLMALRDHPDFQQMTRTGEPENSKNPEEL